VPPGTVVDEDIVANLAVDGYANFMMVPHYALQGSCQVPSYHVLANTAGWTIDQMERLTYDLCYLHFKCNRPISVPVPIYYADKAAARGAHLIDAQHNLIEATDAAIERLYM
jgi:eukaryotic translation initiation factor 2C